MNLSLSVSFKVDGGDPAEEAKARQIVAEETRKLAPAIADRLEAAGIEAEIQGVEESRGLRAALRRLV